MQPRIKKTMRVATTFTGAAACAAAFAPTAATAATAQHGHQIRLDGTRHGVQPDAGITFKSQCPGGTSNWLHIAWAGNHGDACLGGVGSVSFSTHAPGIKGWCGGNNIGIILSRNGQHSYSFGHGTTYLYNIKPDPFPIGAVLMDGWKGNDKCPPP